MQPDISQTPIESVDATVKTLMWSKYRTYTLACVFLWIIVIAGGICLSYTTGIFVPQLLIIPILASTGGYLYVKNKVQTEFTKQFGASIGFTYTETGGGVSGQLFNIGRGQKVYDVLTGVYNNRNCRIFSYKYTIQEGKNSDTVYFTVFEVTFESVMPDIIVSSLAYRFIGSGVPSRGERVELEGDFNKYFQVTVPKGNEVDVYQILSPNVMADLIDKAKNLNFEFSASKLYIYVPKLVTERKDLEQMFDLAKYLDDIFARSTRGIGVPQYTNTNG